jgi:hypothetical protein
MIDLGYSPGGAEHPFWRANDGQPIDNCHRAYRRLSEALPVYAAPDQDVCGVDM